MNYNSIVFKLGATIFVILTAVILPLIFTIDRLIARSYISDAHRQIHQLAEQYSKTLARQGAIDRSSLQTAANLTGTEICIIDRKGKLVFTSNDRLFRRGTHVSRELAKSVILKKEAQIEYKNPINHQTYFVSGNSLHLFNQVEGRLLVFSSSDKIRKSVDHLELLVLASMIGALLLASIFTYVASKKLASPLLQMEKVTREVAKGKFYRKVDISSNDELGSLALAINDLGQELERYRKRQKEFFANVSHDLRTPISHIKGYAQVLHDRLYKNEQEQDLYLSIILDESNQLNALITDLFELSKIEGGQLDLQFNWINIHELVENCFLKVALKAKQRELRLYKELDGKIPFVYTDGVRLEQILMNLLENAIRYNKIEGYVKVKGWVEKKKVHLSIEDSGVGIPDEDLPFIFERFYKIDKSRSNRMGSTGLGLSIVKHLVYLLEGEIKVKSKVNEGTAFHVALPFQLKREKVTTKIGNE
ncbi:sensor histidine kinase [Fictibacillus gelatini]|uniref:sensor histidine kinase n=1 Tax=Fictibacillus gelatini TaxID=225985 RepID=UPI00040C0B72|nr:HAMP domain-containing sensor histidine kinase [Fictibacillus gelatini]